jgi:hypothetical protein
MGFPGDHSIPHDVSSTHPKSLPVNQDSNSTHSACYVQGRNHFNSNGESSSLGRKAFGFMWASVACLTISTVLYCMGGSAGRKDDGYTGRETRRRGFFGPRRSSTKSRGSFRSKREDYAAA